MRNFSQFFFYHSYWGRISHWTQSSFIGLFQLAIRFLGFSLFWADSGLSYLLGIYVDSGDPSSGPHPLACMAFTTEPTPSSTGCSWSSQSKSPPPLPCCDLILLLAPIPQLCQNMIFSAWWQSECSLEVGDLSPPFLYPKKDDYNKCISKDLEYIKLKRRMQWKRNGIGAHSVNWKKPE